MSCNSEYYYAVQSFLDDDELCKIWNIIEIAMNREGYDVENATLSMRLYDSELEENIHYDYVGEYLSSQSEGKDVDYGSKVDALVDSMGVTDKKVSPIHRRKDMDLL
jgi:hypothetical protein